MMMDEYGVGQASDGGMSQGLSEEFTGRLVVTLSEDLVGDARASNAVLQSVPGVSNVQTDPDELGLAEQADATLFSELGIAVVAGGEEQEAHLTSLAGEDSQIVAVEPEGILVALQHAGTLQELEQFLEGYAAAANHLLAEVHEGAADGAAIADLERAAQFGDTAALTWGLQATRVHTSGRSGQGVSVAILDTGFDLRHPDFVGRRITSRSFVPGQAPQDGHGHGTHCTGTTSGPKSPPSGHRRYGIAHNDTIFIGKVLSNQGSGTDAQVLGGINWAVANRCRVISMSLGSNSPQPKMAYTEAGRRALAAGCLIIAAAGNNANRAAGNFGFVGSPANSPFIMAVGAVDEQLRIADFSARSNPVSGGQVDIVGPGVRVDSSWLMPTRYNIISGTSMATPHVAGIAALWSQATGATGNALWGQLVRSARRLPIPSVDVGAGLVQAPQG